MVLYSKRKNSHEDEIKRLISTAAAWIRQEIHKVYNDSSYPSVEDIESGGKNVVPELLDLFINELTKRRRQTSDESQDVRTKRIAVTHIMILQLCRPRSFHSPVQSAFGLYLSWQYGSRNFIKICSSLGYSASYYETEVYLQSLLEAGEPEIERGNFFLFVFDNIDINLRTLDGKDTFHALGGIECITPKTAVSSDVRVERVNAGYFDS